MVLMNFLTLKKFKSIRFEGLFEVILKSNRITDSNFFKMHNLPHLLIFFNFFAQSYDIDIEAMVEATGCKAENTLDLKNPFFHYTGQTPAVPPGTLLLNLSLYVHRMCL